MVDVDEELVDVDEVELAEEDAALSSGVAGDRRSLTFGCDRGEANCGVDVVQLVDVDEVELEEEDGELDESVVVNPDSIKLASGWLDV